MTDNEGMAGNLDAQDRQIIDVLSVDGRITVTALAERIGMSKTPCQVRLQRLIKDGYITGFKATVNYQRLGLGHVAFAEVKLRETTKAALEAFNVAVLEIPEVEQCHMIAGAFDYLLKVRTRNIEAYRAVLGERISALPYVASSSTYVSMQSVREHATD